MTLAITQSRASLGISAPIVHVETHISNGLPRLSIVGLPETVVKESKDRVRSAIINSHFEFPSRRITVNLAPADLPKNGGRFDLAIALGILAASKQISADEFSEYEFAGELALSGDLKPITGVLPFALNTKQCGRSLILPDKNAAEASLIKDIKLYPAHNLLEVCSHFLGKTRLLPHSQEEGINKMISHPEIKEIYGQYHAKRALEITAAGQHSMLLVGPPGVGKTLLSHCLIGLLPPMSEIEAVELGAIQSVAGQSLNEESWCQRPFRSPHHSSSSYALIGGGNPPKPGEISLAHNGVLFLDELPEFKRQALEALREPLESGTISISRSCHQVQYPAKFQLIAAMNPCPCGNYGNIQTECTCSPESIKRYQGRISGPLLDRIDIQVELQHLPSGFLTSTVREGESSAQVAQRVAETRQMQEKRQGKPNALLSHDEILTYCPLGSDEILCVEKLLKAGKISARSYHKILKIARTLADIGQATQIKVDHIKEAFSYRYLDYIKK